MITPKQVKDYIENDGSLCPFCGHNDLVHEFDSETANCLVVCMRCGEVWHEQYKLVDVYQDDQL